MSEQENISVKVVLIGEPAVGKTTLRMSFIGKKLDGEFMTTLGADIAERKLEINSRLILDAQIWDLAGQDNFKPLTKQFLRGAQGAVLVFDLTRSETFDKINEWLELLHEANPAMDNNIPFIIVGNKADLETFIKVDDDNVLEFLEYLNRHHVFSQTDVEYIRTSAKTGYKVDEAFQRLGEIMVENFKQLGDYEEPDDVSHQLETVHKKPDEEEIKEKEPEEVIDEDAEYEQEMAQIRGYANKEDLFKKNMQKSQNLGKKQTDDTIKSKEEKSEEDLMMEKIRMGIDVVVDDDALTRKIKEGKATKEEEEEAMMRKIREGKEYTD